MKRTLKNFSIRMKMVTSHGIIAILSVFCATVALLGIAGLIANLRTVQESAMSCVEATGELMFACADVERSIMGVVLEDSTQHYDMMKEALERDVTEIQTSIYILSERLDKFSASGEARKMSEEISQMFSNSESARLEIMEYLKNGNFVKAQSVHMNDYRVSISRMIAAGEALKEEIHQETEDYCLRVLRVNNVGVIVIILLIVISLILGTYLAHVVSDSVRLPVQQLMEVSEQMKQGNLSAAKNITYESKDEMGTLAASMRETLLFLHSYVEEISDTLHAVANGDLTAQEDSVTAFRGEFASIRESLIYILDHLNETLGSIHQAAGQVNMGAVQIASGAQALAQGAEEQAGSVQELSSAVSDISRQINTTAGNATKAMETSQTTSEQAQVCNAQMQHMMEAMADLTNKASEISKIVKTIEDIAFQTNILALNAAVEAARAGAAGKGFAVVADEVRALAAKSAEASQNTSVLIGGTVEAVNNGTKVLSETAQTLIEVVNDSKAASDLAGQIAEAAAAQATAVTQISQNIEDISGVVNTTSSTAEESAAASQELSGQATMLSGMLEQFRLRDSI